LVAFGSKFNVTAVECPPKALVPRVALLRGGRAFKGGPDREVHQLLGP
jgi:hypothetical protein